MGADETTDCRNVPATAYIEAARDVLQQQGGLWFSTSPRNLAPA